jgi:Asp-tRNA(Asn)/Glu-tRNA(Gln) amidotransferase A subunit family amidase
MGSASFEVTVVTFHVAWRRSIQVGFALRLRGFAGRAPAPPPLSNNDFGASRRDVLATAGALALTAAAPVFADAANGRHDSIRTSAVIDIDLAYMPASLQLDLFRARKLSPVEVLEAQIDRHERHNDSVNATTYTHFEKAMEEARESEARWMNGTARPLEGITCALKDEHHEAGMTVAAGSALLKDAVRDYTDEVTAKLKQAGVVTHMQTTVPEFYVYGVTFSRLWGVTRNPWNLNYTVGGSSGGTGAALAAGMTTLGTGSDMGDSVRLPSAYCGLCGFKPPFGRITTEQPLSPFAGTGPMARTFTDMTRMQNAMAGQTPHAPFTLPGVEMPLAYEGIEGMRIALSPDLGGFAKISSEMRALTMAAAERLAALGAEVVEVDLDLGSDLAEMTDNFFKVFWSGSMGGGLAAAFADGVDGSCPRRRRHAPECSGHHLRRKEPPNAGYDSRTGSGQGCFSGSWRRARRRGCLQSPDPASAGAGILQEASGLPCRDRGLRLGASLGARAESDRA